MHLLNFIKKNIFVNILYSKNEIILISIKYEKTRKGKLINNVIVLVI